MNALNLPKYSENKIFNYLKEVTDVASLSPEERDRYERDLKRYRDAYSLDVTYEHILENYNKANADLKEAKADLKEAKAELKKAKAEAKKETQKEAKKAKKEGQTEGRVLEKFAIAMSLKKMNFSLIDISNATGLSIKEIEDIDIN
jgi:predicted transposase/invertase (TIGR01784 family)